MVTHTKRELIEGIILGYHHNPLEEGELITKRRLWYILKPNFLKLALQGITHRGKQVKPVSYADFGKYFNDLAREQKIDDTFISDESRETGIGNVHPHIVLVSEKATIAPTLQRLADRLGISYHIAGGFSSIYAVKKLVEGIRERSDQPIEILLMTDWDKSGIEIQSSLIDHVSLRAEVILHRLLISPETVPAGKVDDFYEISSKGEKYYELDVLSLPQLQDVFFQNFPTHLRTLIEKSFEASLLESAKNDWVWREINKNAEMEEIAKELEVLRIKQGNLEAKLYEDIEPTFNESFVTLTTSTLEDMVTLESWETGYELK